MDILGRGSLHAAIPELDFRMVRGRGAQALAETGVGWGSQNPISGGSSWHLQSQIEVTGVKQNVLHVQGGRLWLFGQSLQKG